MLSLIRWLIQREAMIVSRTPWLVFRNLIFLAICFLVFPFCLGNNTTVLSNAGPALLWVILVFLNMIAAEGLFDSDHQSGVTDQLIVAGVPLWCFWMLRALRHWLLSGVLLVSTIPLWWAGLCLDAQALPPLITGLFLGSLHLSLVSALGASLTLGYAKAALPLFAVPLMVPSIVCGTAMLNKESFLAGTLWLVTMLCGLSPILAIAGDKALRSHAENR